MSSPRESRPVNFFFRHYVEWLWKTGMEASEPAKIAYCIVEKLTAPESYTEILVDKTDELFREAGKEGLGRLLQWKIKPCNMDLLQLSVLCSDVIAMTYLTQDPVVKAVNYKVPDNGTENHPVHLACVLGHASCLWDLLLSLETVPWDQGQVTLTRNTLSSLTWLALPTFVCKTSKGTPVELALQFDRKDCLPILFMRAIREVSQDPPTSASLARNIFQLVSSIFDIRDTSTACVQLSVLSHEKKLTKDLLYLFCEFLHSSDFSFTGDCNLTCLPMIYNGDEHDYRTMARYMTMEQLKIYCELLKRQLGVKRNFIPPPRNLALPCSHVLRSYRDISLCTMQIILDAFLAEQKERNLQWSCALAHRKFLNKDPRSLWLEGELPGGLRPFFPIPFQKWFQSFAQEASSTPS